MDNQQYWKVLIQTTKCTFFYCRDKRWTKQRVLGTISWYDCKCLVDIYIQMSFSCKRLSPAGVTAESYANACVRVSDVVSFYLRSLSRRTQAYVSALYVCTLVWRCYAELSNEGKKKEEEEENTDKHWLHSEQGWGHFTFSLNVLSQRSRQLRSHRAPSSKWWEGEEFKLKSKSPQPAVRCYRWHSLSRGQWSFFLFVCFFSGQLGWMGMTSEVVFLCTWCCQHVFSEDLTDRVWMNAIKRYCKQQGRQRRLTQSDMTTWRW